MDDRALHAALHAHFGFAAFRPGQLKAVRAALADRDALVVMPTGAGKSLCYQLPALLRPDLTIVVSPLVSLMEDQVAALSRRAPGRVAVVHGQRGAAANDAALADTAAGRVSVLHVAPERFGAPGFEAALAGRRVGLFVVDEAHCVSQWGHDFRPDYLRLGAAARRLGARCVLASTATATPEVAEDVVAQLGLVAPVRVATGFDRPNLAFAVARGADRPAQLAAALADPAARPAIVYAGTRREVEALAGSLAAALGRPVVAYHAGLERRARAEAQRRFMAGEVDVVVATNAFGMGVDKADVRTVAHAAVPPSLEAYYQEAGRAGRDGGPARALLLTADRDKGLHAHFARRAAVTDADVERVALRLEAAAGGRHTDALPGLEPPPPPFDVALVDLAAPAPLAATRRAALRSGATPTSRFAPTSPAVPDPRGPGPASGAGGEPPSSGDLDRTRAIVAALARVGVAELEPSRPDRVRGRLVGPFDPAAQAACRALAERAQRARWAQYRAMWEWVEAPRCRRAGLLAHFGDPAAPRADGPCCDRCDPAVVPPAVLTAAVPAAPSRDLAAAAAALAPLAPDQATLVAALRGRHTRGVRRLRLDQSPAFGLFDDHTAGELRAALTTSAPSPVAA